MEFRKTLPTILHAWQQRKHRCKNRPLDTVGEYRVGCFERIALKHVHYHIFFRDDQWKFDAWDGVHKDTALGQPRGIEWGGRWGVVQDG